MTFPLNYRGKRGFHRKLQCHTHLGGPLDVQRGCLPVCVSPCGLSSPCEAALLPSCAADDPDAGHPCSCRRPGKRLVISSRVRPSACNGDTTVVESSVGSMQISLKAWPAHQLLSFRSISKKTAS